jgi:hypothetical protein
MTSIFFDFLLAYAAFIDTLEISVYGERAKRPLSNIRLGKNSAVGSSRSNYARSQHGTCCLTGNPFEHRYGPFGRNQRRVPPHRIIIRSETAPLTSWSVRRVLDAMFRPGYRAVPSQCEITFDTHIPLRFLREHEYCRLSMRRFKSSICFGSSRSSWRVRVYKKAPSVIRLEFVLRRGLLRSSKINSIESLSKVTQLGLFDWFPIRELRDRSAVGDGSVPPGLREASMRKLRRFCAVKKLAFQNLTKQCPEERALRRMLGRFVW